MSELNKKILEEFKVIGRHKYNYLKRKLSKLNYEDENELVKFRDLEKISVSEAERMIEKYESKHNTNHKTNKKEIEYFKKIRQKEVKKEEKKLSPEDFKKQLFNRFMLEYYKLNGVKYSLDGVYYENLKPIFYYFLGDFESFLKCDNLLKSDKCKPSLKKGLLIVGNYGNGKTSTLEAFSKVTKSTKKQFEIIGTKEAVTNYSFLKNDSEAQHDFYNKLVKRQYLFDDLLKEGNASSYGLVNLIEQVLEEKYRIKSLAHATLNYPEVNGKVIEDVEKAIEQLGVKYGGYMYDRAFSMFNIIEFKGKSLRK